MLLEANNFERINIKLDEVYLDPNNPRFSDSKKIQIEEGKIIEAIIQKNALERIMLYGVNDLVGSIKNTGFLKIDQVVVRKIKGIENKYVVIEGNRRIAACKLIQESFNAGECSKKIEEIIDTVQNLEVLLYKGDEEDISWIIQGIRHISGVKSWKPFQQAQLLVSLEEKNIEPQIAAETLGIGPIVATRLVRAYFGFRQAQNDDEFGSYIAPTYFAYFNEVVFSRTKLRDWLEWNDNEREFKNSKNLSKMLSWFIPTGDNETETKISQARELRDIVVKAMIEEPDLFKKFETDDKMTADDLQFALGQRTAVDQTEWFEKMEEFLKALENLPTIKILNKKDAFLAVFSEIIKKLCQHKEILENVEKV